MTLANTFARRFGSGAAIAAALLAASAAAPRLCGQDGFRSRSASSPVAARAGAARTEIKLYAVPRDRLADLVSQLQEKYAEQSAVRIIADERTSKVVVSGSPAVQQDVILWLDLALAAPGSEPVDSAAAKASASPPPSRTDVAHSAHALRNISARAAEHSLAAIWGKKASVEASPAGEATTIRLHSGKPAEVKLVIDHQRDLVMIDAPRQAMDSWRRVIQAVDASREKPSEQTAVVPFAKADPTKIQRAIGLIGAATKDPAAVAKMLAAATGARRRAHIGQFVSMVFQPEGGQPAPAGQPAPEGGQPDVTVEQGSGDVADAIGRIGNVQIEFVPGLDILIIRGDKRDVELVRRIIQQIEELSLQTQPEVEIYYLQHVDGEQMSTLVNQIYTSVFASRQSTVTITPLVKPNALLLIGRKEAIAPVVDLIRRLDQPTLPDVQTRVFPLKHLPVIDAERTVRSLFTPRPGFGADLMTGLGGKVRVMADFRSNSLIVQAGPRDLGEVEDLLTRLDVPDGPANNEVRVFKLRNSLAEDLAPVLQEAITGEVQGQQRQQFQQQIQGQQGGSGGTPTPSTSAPRSAGVQILRVDGQGREIIASGILSDFRVTADARNNTLIVVGPPASMSLMEELIHQLDTLPGAEAQVKVFTITNGDATQLATMLQTLFGLQTGGQAGQVPFGAQSVTGSGDTTLVPLRFSVDTRTNSIVATGSAGDLAVVYSILARLDEGGIRQRELKVFRLKNTSAEAVADALNSFLTAQMQLLQQQGQLVSALELIEQQVIVEDEPVTNSLIVSATPRRLPEIEAIINDLDRRNPMVVIQLLIAEVTLNDLNEFGAEFGLQDSLLFQRGIPIPGFNFNNQPLGNTTTGVNTENTAGQGLTSFGVGRSSGAAGFGGLVLSASSESVSILIRALQNSSRAQILSRPQIQTMDNQPAFVQVGARVPRLGGQTVTNNLVTQDVTDVNVGIILGVTPRVTPDGMVVMEIDAEKSEVGPDETAIPVGVGGDGTPILSPQILTNLAQTTITARSGQTVILGGLISRSEGESTRRVPYLSDVPVLGRLFRFDSTSIERRELIFILTPYIMDSPETESLLNLRETERMSWCLADVMNIHGALPEGASGIDPRHPHSPLIFPDETPAGPSVLEPSDPLMPLRSIPAPMTPTPAVPPPGLENPPATDNPSGNPPQSSRRPTAPDSQATAPNNRWQPAGMRPLEVQQAIQYDDPAPHGGQAPSAGTPLLRQEPPPSGNLAPAAIAPAGYQQPVEPEPQYPVTQASIYDLP